MIESCVAVHDAGPLGADEDDDAADDGEDGALEVDELTLGGLVVVDPDGGADVVVSVVDDNAEPLPLVVTDEVHPPTSPATRSTAAPVARELIGRSADLSSTAGC